MGMPWDCGSKPVLEVNTQFPLPLMGKEQVTPGSVAQLITCAGSPGLLTLVRVKTGVTVKLEEYVPPSEVVSAKLICPLPVWFARPTAMW